MNQFHTMSSEKRIFIAILLSWIILVSYQGFGGKKVKQGETGVNTPQPIENNKVAESQGSMPIVLNDEENQELGFSQDETVEIIENDNLQVEISNLGGIIKNVIIKKYDHSLPISGIFNIDGFNHVLFKRIDTGNTVATFVYKNEEILVEKKYDLALDPNLIVCELTIKNISPVFISKKLTIDNFVIDASLLGEKIKNPRDRALLEYSISQNGQITRKNNAYKFSEKESIKKHGNVDWIGFRDRYFCAIFRKEYVSDSYILRRLDKEKLKISTETETVGIGPNQKLSFQAEFFVGPQDLEILKSYEKDFDKIMSFSRFKLIDFISKTALRVLSFIHSFIPSLGICIIILGFLVYGCMYPLTMKGMYSMRRMQNIQPEMSKLREQYKNNPQKLNKEMMDLYKKHKVNPFGGCFPFLLQMPVFIAFYQALWRSVAFKGAKFLWIKDLSEPDRLFILPFNLPIIGNEINILPLLMVIIMVAQQKLTSKNMMCSDPNQVMQQKIMSTVFPVFIGFIFYKFASGLALYFMVFYVFSTFTQWKMSKIPRVV